MLISACLTSCSYEQKNNSPGAGIVGQQVFVILKNFNDYGEGDWLGNFLSIDELRAIASDTSLVWKAKARNKLTRITKQEWIQGLKAERERILHECLQYKVELSSIEYSDYTYELDDDEGFKATFGTLYFTYNNRMFQIRTKAIWTGRSYKLSSLSDLYYAN
jgi:hypothetical protein